jgi:hypothetical protein
MRTPRRHPAISSLAGATILLALALGCSRDLPQAPDLQSAPTLAGGQNAPTTGNGVYFPLGQGNEWHAVGKARFVTVDLSGAPIGESIAEDDYLRTIDGTEERFGRVYTLMREVFTESVDGGAPDEATNWVRYRQDASGLYEADVDPSTPPGGEPPAVLAAAARARTRSMPEHLAGSVSVDHRAAFQAAWERLRARGDAIREAVRGPGGGPVRTAEENEITRLRYPLHPGQAWVVRADPEFTSSVEAVENLDIAAGRFTSHRIRIESGLFGPNDRVHLWMSRSGQLALAYHLEIDATDQDGNVIGRVTNDYQDELHDLNLAAR